MCQNKSDWFIWAKIKLQIWDAACNERFRNIASTYYRSCKGIIVVFDVYIANSFYSLSNWIKSLVNLAFGRKSVSIIGNKTDVGAWREVSYEEAKRFAEGNEINYIEV